MEIRTLQHILSEFVQNSGFPDILRFSKIFKVPKKIFEMPECGVNEIAPIFSHIKASQRFF